MCLALIRIVRLLERLKELNYERIYRDLCESRKHRNLNKCSGYHVHHILPISCGGSNDPTNLVKLTYREHYIAHRLLVKFLSGVNLIKMKAALHFMNGRPDIDSKIKSGQEYNPKVLPIISALDNESFIDNITLDIYPTKIRPRKEFYKELGLNRENFSIKLIECIHDVLCSLKKNLCGYKTFSIYMENNFKTYGYMIRGAFKFLCEYGLLVDEPALPHLPKRFSLTNKLVEMLETDTLKLPHCYRLKAQDLLNVGGIDFIIHKVSHGVIIIYPRFIKNLLLLNLDFSAKYLFVRIKSGSLNDFKRIAKDLDDTGNLISNLD